MTNNSEPMAHQNFHPLLFSSLTLFMKAPLQQWSTNLSRRSLSRLTLNLHPFPRSHLHRYLGLRTQNRIMTSTADWGRTTIRTDLVASVRDEIWGEPSGGNDLQSIDY